MSVLVVGVTGSTPAAGVEVAIVDDHGEVAARARRPVDLAAPESVWRGLLAATEEVLDADTLGAPRAVSVTDHTTTLVLWDVETLGSPRPALEGGGVAGVADVGDRIARVAEHEPHTWALVLEGQYALGTYESYLVARMSRGTYHVTDPVHAGRAGLLDPETGGWATTRCAELDVPLDALPEVVAGAVLARTEPRSFLGLDLPVVPAR